MSATRPFLLLGASDTGSLRIGSWLRACRREKLARICVALGGMIAAYAAVAQERPSSPNAAVIDFHIPSQPLVNALQAYGEQTGVQVLYESRSAAGRQSAAVEGSFKPDEALNLLLTGTDLKVRYTRPDAITLARPGEAEGPPASPFAKADLSLGTLRVRASDDGDTTKLHDYSESVQADVQKALQKNARTRNGSYRAVLDLWIDPSRTIERTKLYQSTGDVDRDTAVAAALHGVIISKPAPANMPQPIRVAIVVRSVQ
jgi:hypothetical protein